MKIRELIELLEKLPNKNADLFLNTSDNERNQRQLISKINIKQITETNLYSNAAIGDIQIEIF